MDVGAIATNFGVAGVMLFIAYILATQSIPKAFETIMVEMRLKRTEFLEALKEERDSRRSDRDLFLAAITAERIANERLRAEQNQLFIAAMSRLESKFETSLALISERMGQLTEAVNAIVDERRVPS